VTPVYEHAVRSLAALRTRDLVVLAAWVLACVIAPVAALSWTLALKIFGVVVTGIRELPGMHKIRQRTDGGQRVDDEVGKLLRTGSLVILLAAACTALQVFLPLNFLDTGVFDESLLGFMSRDTVVLLAPAILLLLVPWCAAWWHQKLIWGTVSQDLGGRNSKSPAAVPDETNVVIYSGYRPFVGSGNEDNSWTLALPLVPAAGGQFSPKVFDTNELVERLKSEFHTLAKRADGLAGLTVTEKLYVNGSALDGPEPFGLSMFWPRHPSRTSGKYSDEFYGPVEWVSEDDVASARGLIDGPVRHCLFVQVMSWGTDVVLSAHLQLAVNAGTLHVHSTSSVLTPVRSEYREIDRLADPDGGGAGVRVAVSAFSVMCGSGRSPLARALWHYRERLSARGSREEQMREVIALDRAYDAGASHSLRELAESGRYENYFQRVDVMRASRQIELCLFSSIGKLMKEHGLATSEFDERRSVIMNNGVIVTGGTINGAFAAGAGAGAVSFNGAFLGS
jgi:hypothetical protein